MTRNEQIKELRKKQHLTYREIGEQFHISRQRVSQIIYPLEGIKKRLSLKKAQIASLKKYAVALKTVTQDGLLGEINRLSIPNRRKEVIAQKKLLVEQLRNKYQFTFKEIGFLLQMDHTSIIHLYYK